VPHPSFIEERDSKSADRLGFSLTSRNLTSTLSYRKRPASTVTDPNRPSATAEIDPWQGRGVPVNKTALKPAQPHSCRHRRQPKSPTRETTPDRAPAHQENEFCNNHSVISTRLCLSNHNRHRVLSITYNPTPRPKFRVYFLCKYISIRTIIHAQNVPRGTLYVQPWATRSAEVVDDEDMLSKGTGPVGG